MFANVQLNANEPTQTLNLNLHALDPIAQRVVAPENVSKVWPGAYISDNATITLTFNGDEVHANWASTYGLSGNVSLTRAEAIDSWIDDLDLQEISWREFQDEISSLFYGKQIFRGQSGNWPLRSSFHRTMANDLVAYFERSIPSVRRQLTPFLQNTSFDGPEGELALLHLLQHYGYPTPLIDWSYSPYIAAYFAYAPKEANGRYIFTFDKEKWEVRHPAKVRVGFCEPHISIVEALPILNDRTLPQQGLSMMTNIASVEAYIRAREEKFKELYLNTHRLRDSDREEALNDLTMMGISPATIFPGLEGACQAMKARHFGY